MPVRFQVDPDFYDHPKVIGMSDAATALWVRAGSYSVAKLLDGFVPEDALSLLSRCPEEASGELVQRGMWKRTRGGFRFHQWDHRNLTRARVDADREYERERKQRQRHNARRNGNPQVEDGTVPAGRTPGQPGGQDWDSRRSPNRSVSVSESESVSIPPTPRRGKPGAPADDDPDWATFWDTYPLKRDKGHARKAWAKAVKTIDPAAIIAAAARYRDDPNRKPDYTAYPATWLNGERWTDQPATSPAETVPRGWWDN